MKEIIISGDIQAIDGYEAAYRQGVIDMYSTLGLLHDATKWLWIDLATNSLQRS